MNRRIFRVAGLGTMAAMLVASSVTAVDMEGAELSACVTSDQQLVKVAIGDAPASACSADEAQVRWSIGRALPEPEKTTAPIEGVTLGTREIEPGVVEVVNDGVRSLSRCGRMWEDADRIVAGGDGGVWLFSPAGFYRLGDEIEHSWGRGTGPYGDIEIGPDGTVWWTSEDGTGDLHTYDGRVWAVGKKAPKDGAVRELEMDATGTLWAGWKNNDTRAISVGYLDETGEWRRVGSWHQETGDFRGPLLSATGDGEVWLLIEHPVGGDIWHLLDVDSKDWEPLQQPKGDIVRLHATPEGTVWARNADREVVHYDGSDWIVYDESDGVPSIDMGWPNRHAAPDGSFWLSVFEPWGGRCDGVANFDGTEWTSYLEGFCVHALDVATDGDVWLTASESGPDGPWGADSSTVRTFVIASAIDE